MRPVSVTLKTVGALSAALAVISFLFLPIIKISLLGFGNAATGGEFLEGLIKSNDEQGILIAAALIMALILGTIGLFVFLADKYKAGSTFGRISLSIIGAGTIYAGSKLGTAEFFGIGLWISIVSLLVMSSVSLFVSSAVTDIELEADRARRAQRLERWQKFQSNRPLFFTVIGATLVLLFGIVFISNRLIKANSPEGKVSEFIDAAKALSYEEMFKAGTWPQRSISLESFRNECEKSANRDNPDDKLWTGDRRIDGDRLGERWFKVFFTPGCSYDIVNSTQDGQDEFVEAKLSYLPDESPAFAYAWDYMNPAPRDWRPKKFQAFMRPGGPLGPYTRQDPNLTRPLEWDGRSILLRHGYIKSATITFRLRRDERIGWQIVAIEQPFHQDAQSLSYQVDIKSSRFELFGAAEYSGQTSPTDFYNYVGTHGIAPFQGTRLRTVRTSVSTFVSSPIVDVSPMDNSYILGVGKFMNDRFYLPDDKWDTSIIGRSGVQILPEGVTAISNPHFTARGDSIVARLLFSGRRAQIHMVALDGKHSTPISPDRAEPFNIPGHNDFAKSTLSADAKQILYYNYERSAAEGFGKMIYRVLDRKTARETTIEGFHQFSDASFLKSDQLIFQEWVQRDSANSSWLSCGRVSIFDLNSLTFRELVPAPAITPSDPQGDHRPILLDYDDAGQIVLCRGDNGSLFVINVQSGKSTVVCDTIMFSNGVRGHVSPISADLSPDGKRVVFVSNVITDYCRAVYCVNSDGSNLQQITYGMKWFDWVRFGGDGHSILCTMLGVTPYGLAENSREIWMYSLEPQPIDSLFARIERPGRPTISDERQIEADFGLDH
jgi:hypothetical protein